MVLIRTLVMTSLLAHIMSSFFVRGNAEPWSTEIPSSASSPFLYYVDVFLGESPEPRTLGIRNGQTVIQAAKRFCLENGFDNNLQAAIIPQLAKVLQDGIATSIEGNVSTIYDAALPPRYPDQSSMASEDVDTSMDQSSMASEDMHTSMDQSSMVSEDVETSMDQSSMASEDMHTSMDQSSMVSEDVETSMDQSSTASEDMHTSMDQASMAREDVDTSMDQSSMASEDMNISMDQNSMVSEYVDTSMDQASMAREDVDTPVDQSSLADSPIVTLDVSLDGMEARTVNYYAGQDPMEVAAIFCAENLGLSSPAEAFARCSNSLSASIIEWIRDPLDAPSGHESTFKQQDRLRTKTVEPWLTVPLNVNGLETVLEIYWGSSPDDLAADFCRREEFGFYGPRFDSCFYQIAQIVRRAILIQGVRQGGENIEQGEVKPFTINIPVTLAGRKLHVEFRTSETPRESALRFCVANLLAIESALGIELGDGNEYSQAVGYGGMGETVYGFEERDTLKDVCVTIVEDAINAVLLGLRKRVAEAEMALANATKTMTD